MALLSGLAWLLDSPYNKPPPTVDDTLGVAALDTAARKVLDFADMALEETERRAYDRVKVEL